MTFFDDKAYTAILRQQHTSASGLVSGLAFSSTGDQICALVSSGRLTVASTTFQEGNAPKTVVLPGYARALCSGEGGLYAAGDFGLLTTRWAGDKAALLFSDTRVSALARGREGVFAALEGGWLALVEANDHPVKLFGGLTKVNCLAALPSGGFLAGCDDGFVHQYDVRAGRDPVRKVRVGTAAVTALATDADGTFALAGNYGFELASIHLSTASIVASSAVPFRPRAIAFSKGQFYVGGSDRIDEPTRCLLRVGFGCQILGSTPASAKSVYAIAVHHQSGALAAAGYSPDVVRKSGTAVLKGEIVDVYIDPPVRSFSIAV